MYSKALPGPLTRIDTEQFARDGYIKLRQIAKPEDVDFIRSRIIHLFETHAGREEGALFDFAGTDEDGSQMALPQLLDVRSYAPEILATDFYRNATKAARQVLGPKARLVADHAIFKPALYGSETPFHQDDAFKNDPYSHNEVSIWLSLQVTNELNGCLQFVPGTHLRPLLPHRRYRDDPKIHALECYSGWLPSDTALCPLEAGDCTVHTNRTLHGAGPNRSPNPRYAYVIIFATSPVRRASAPNHAWLSNSEEERLRRRRAWFLRGGLLVHSLRRVVQLRHVGAREVVRRLVSRMI